MQKWLIIFIAACTLFLAGCKKEQEAPKPAAQKPVTAVAKPAEQAAEAPQAVKEVYEYGQKGRRDPFVSLVQVAKEKPKRLRGTKPIENFDVDEIKLIAILWDNKQYYALITLPDGKSYTIRKGTTLGLYGGKVEYITKDSMLIREQVKDYRGQLRTKDTILQLRKEGE
ncbi:MAG: pilus assembly protein PilP [Nitrospiraceae bacterium]|nr:pilus assembly protein PilP [Nitrospiraceae bacterium]